MSRIKNGSGVNGEAWTIPRWWRNLLLFCASFNALFGWLYTSGYWAAKRHGCTVELSWLDAAIGDGVAICGIVTVISLLGAFTMMPSPKD